MSLITKHLSERIRSFKTHPVTRRATVTIEALTPLHIGSGSETENSDAGVVLDANGLAILPGSSIKGVLRSAYRHATGLRDDDPVVTGIFGFQRGDQGQGSRIRVTWGRVHDKNDHPVSGLLDSAALPADDVLDSAAAPELRDHARLNGKGIAENKFDEVSIIAGHRFTFRLEFIGNDSPEDAEAWATLLAILRRDDLRLGGKTRRGLGSFKLVRLQADHDDTSAQVPPRFNLLHDLRLQPDSDCFWMFGGGADLDGRGSADSSPVRASRVVWNDHNSPRVEQNVLVVPGSAVKGPLRHRTLFHLCRRLGEWAENGLSAPQSHRALHLLFGDVDLDESKRQTSGRTDTKDVASVGRIFIDDLYLAEEDKAKVAQDQQNHVAIDRVTGGAFDHALYSDRPLHGGGFRLLVRYEPPAPKSLTEADSQLLETAKQSLADAVKDLGNGMLALGAHGSRGYGWFDQLDSQPA